MVVGGVGESDAKDVERRSVDGEEWSENGGWWWCAGGRCTASDNCTIVGISIGDVRYDVGGLPSALAW